MKTDLYQIAEIAAYAIIGIVLTWWFIVAAWAVFG